MTYWQPRCRPRPSARATQHRFVAPAQDDTTELELPLLRPAGARARGQRCRGRACDLIGALGPSGTLDTDRTDHEAIAQDRDPAATGRDLEVGDLAHLGEALPRD